ncbi:MAG: hypothetical protein A3G18_13005 [Rhodospirillales bacterium RIFCSPLOWO2_12_FULL_58_28]|nr:MAG: hypothetical protein A3H92_12860 [Rhodospirillales bacterium RIFCSPLOWO2_02_FULL_58_16]OHC78501.1 MAG: hypothetical protein A3G18_13005 [Rhodospirillales bacterium RIFCSPLOWO2_12_FULL_58_28]
MPSHPWTISAYLRWCERSLRSPDIDLSIKAIARAHLLNCLKSPDRHPMVARTLRMIEARLRSKASRSDLFRPEDFLMRNKVEDEAAPLKPLRPDRKVGAKRAVRILRSTPKLVSRRF